MTTVYPLLWPTTTCMSSETDSGPEQRVESPRRPPWVSGVFAGLIGGVLMGVVMMTAMPGVLDTAIPALVGMAGIGAGWVVHLSISAVFGVVFAALVTVTPLRRYGDSYGRSLVVGAAYGAVLWLVAAAIVMPIWLSAVGFPSPPPVPNLNSMSLLAHLVFGASVGLTYPAIHRAPAEEPVGERETARARQ